MATADIVLGTSPLGFVWETADPFLFCVHHLDDYPHGDAQLAPAKPLTGRALGSDFSGKDGWSMYHGRRVPGFPRHPHRGFETVTLVRTGLIDHSDSLGATARFGQGDCQWMTAGRGIEHSEMFPLVRVDEPNPLELFQIWLNLPRKSKFVEPYFAMLWAGAIPRTVAHDAAGRSTEVVTVAGALPGAAQACAPPPPDSWAAAPEHEVAIWTITMEPGAEWTVPAASEHAVRTLYFFEGESLAVGGAQVAAKHAVTVRPGVPVPLINGAKRSELLMLQGRPIGEKVVQQGPFVMNSTEEIQRAFVDYRAGVFGKWPWKQDDPVHARDAQRFAIHATGVRETP